jgi:hypothetical protein
MPDFKLISADSHINEPPAARERTMHPLASFENGFRGFKCLS